MLEDERHEWRLRREHAHLRMPPSLRCQHAYPRTRRRGGVGACMVLHMPHGVCHAKAAVEQGGVATRRRRRTSASKYATHSLRLAKPSLMIGNLRPWRVEGRRD